MSECAFSNMNILSTRLKWNAQFEVKQPSSKSNHQATSMTLFLSDVGKLYTLLEEKQIRGSQRLFFYRPFFVFCVLFSC